MKNRAMAYGFWTTLFSTSGFIICCKLMNYEVWKIKFFYAS